MRIRKPSIASLSSSLREKEFLLPDSPHTRSAQNWRNVLLGCNAQSEADQVGEEGEKPYYRSNGIVRIREDKMRLLTNEGACMKEDNSSRARQEMMVESERGVPKLGLLEKSLVSMPPGVKRKRSRVVRSAKYDSSSERNEIIWRDNKQPRDAKPMAANDKDDVPLQCRRRKCCERTSVGYSLCDHHVGKMRLESLNEKKEVLVKGTKFKELRLIEAACKAVHNGKE